MFNRLITRRLDSDGDSTFDSGESFVYDAPPGKGGLSDVVLVFDDTGSLTHRYLHGPAVDQVFADEDALGEILWSLGDNQNSVRDLVEYDAGTDTTSVVNHIEYDSFGNITAQSSAGDQPQLAWTGRYRDPDTGLQWNLHRWYDPVVGRWLSEDPIGFAAGDSNLARYVSNNSPNRVDPSGLDSEITIPLTNPQLLAPPTMVAVIDPVSGETMRFVPVQLQPTLQVTQENLPIGHVLDWPIVGPALREAGLDAGVYTQPWNSGGGDLFRTGNAVTSSVWIRRNQAGLLCNSIPGGSGSGGASTLSLRNLNPGTYRLMLRMRILMFSNTTLGGASWAVQPASGVTVIDGPDNRDATGAFNGNVVNGAQIASFPMTVTVTVTQPTTELLTWTPSIASAGGMNGETQVLSAQFQLTGIEPINTTVAPINTTPDP